MYIYRLSGRDEKGKKCSIASFPTFTDLGSWARGPSEKHRCMAVQDGAHNRTELHRGARCPAVPKAVGRAARSPSNASPCLLEMDRECVTETESVQKIDKLILFARRVCLWTALSH